MNNVMKKAWITMTMAVMAGTAFAQVPEFKRGVGLDTKFTAHLFLRTELFYGIKLPGKMDKYLQDERQNIDWALHHGGDFKIAVGYRF